MLTALQAYKIYLPLKLHFTTENYDIRKYAGVPVTEKAWANKGNVKYKLAGLARKYQTAEEVGNFFLANFVAGDQYGGLYHAEAEQRYFEWKRTMDGLKYRFTQDVELMAERHGPLVEAWMAPPSGQHPVLLREYWGKKLALETLVILDKMYKYVGVLDTQMADDPMWKPLSLRLRKYRPFVRIDTTHYHTILSDL